MSADKQNEHLRDGQVTYPSRKGDQENETGADRNNGAKEKKEDALKTDRKPPVYKKPAFIVGISILLVALIVGGGVFWLIARQYVSTDDAYVDGHTVEVSGKVAAQVLKLQIVDNQFVKKGDVLVQLDPTDYEVALQQARAQVSSAQGRLAQARAQAESAAAAIPQAEAGAQSAKASLDNATRDKRRFEDLDDYARSREQLDNVRTVAATTQAQYDQARARVQSANADLLTAQAAIKTAEGDLELARANENKAEVNLSYCKIIAPIDGRVTERTVEPGNYVTPGQALFVLVDPDVWITANFKETQLTHIRPGQPVTIKVDAFPGQKFQGHVDSIQAGSGARFSVLPVENATGNFVKVVQRVPVKITFEHGANTNNAPMLSPGLSVIPRVKVR